METGSPFTANQNRYRLIRDLLALIPLEPSQTVTKDFSEVNQPRSLEEPRELCRNRKPGIMIRYRPLPL